MTLFAQTDRKPLFADRLFYKDGLLDVFSEPSVRRASALIQCGVTLILSSLAFFFNVLEQNDSMLFPLSMLIAVALLCIIWVTVTHSGHVPLIIINISLMTLGIFLLVRANSGSEGYLFWFLLFPPMLMLCLGMRYGSLVFGSYYLLLTLLFFTPLNKFLCVSLSLPTQLRFFTAMLGAYAFSALLEAVRSNTYAALVRTIHRLESEVLTDPLTGIGNRREFYMFCNWVHTKAKRNSTTFALAMIDIDHFKQINDTYGHECGDMMLHSLAKILTSSIRAGDKAFRWGGEEFLVIMPETSIQEAHQTAERLRKIVESSPFTYQGKQITSTISVGVYSNSADEPIADQLLKVDELMYLAKRSGRNQVQSCLSVG